MDFGEAVDVVEGTNPVGVCEQVVEDAFAVREAFAEFEDGEVLE